jgi:hypothetical protein
VYYFHDFFGPGRVTKVLSGKFPNAMNDGEYKSIEGFTGKDVKGAEIGGVVFPVLLEPVDDLPPGTIVTSVRVKGNQIRVAGVTQDNGEVESVLVNGAKAQIRSAAPGIVEWEVKVQKAGMIEAKAVDKAGNEEKMTHVVKVLAPTE